MLKQPWLLHMCQVNNFVWFVFGTYETKKSMPNFHGNFVLGKEKMMFTIDRFATCGTGYTLNYDSGDCEVRWLA